jgi:4-hydroxy-2-oxoheptanedioate aldolase
VRKPNELKRRLQRGEPVLGTWSVLPSPSVANVIAAAGFDFLIIDLEHGPASLETAESMVRAVESEGRTPLVRVPANLDWLILRGLEIGAHGVVIPQVTTAEEARAAVRAVKYHPEGTRGFSPYTRSGGYSAGQGRELASRENVQTMAVLLVEGVTGIGNLDDILAVPGIDVAYLGVYDLSQSAGHPGEPDHPEVLAFVEACVSKIRAADVAAGCLAQSAADVDRFRELGIQFVAYEADCALLFRACTDIRARFER